MDIDWEAIAAAGVSSKDSGLNIRQAILDLALTPTPEAVNVSFFCPHQTTGAITIWERRTGDPDADHNTPGTFASLRALYPAAHFFSERLDGIAPRTLAQDTPYWLRIEVTDFDEQGNQVGVLQTTRSFRTYRRDLNVLALTIDIQQDSDSLGKGEFVFDTRLYDARSRLGIIDFQRLPEKSGDTFDISDGHSVVQPFGAGAWHVDRGPRQIGYYLSAWEDDRPGLFEQFITLGGIYLDVGRTSDETAPDEAFATAYDSDDGPSAENYVVYTLPDGPGEYSGAIAIQSPYGKIMYLLHGVYWGTVTATAQPLYVPNPGSAMHRVADSAASSIRIAGTALGRREKTKFKLGPKGELIADAGARGSVRLDGPTGISRLHAAGSRDGKADLLIEAGGEVFRASYDPDKVAFDKPELLKLKLSTPLVPRPGEVPRFTALTVDGMPVLVDESGKPSPIGPKRPGDRLLAVEGKSGWYLAVRDAKGMWAFASGDTRAGGKWVELDPRLGSIFTIAEDKRGPIMLGLDARRNLMAQRPGKEIETLGNYEALQEKEHGEVAIPKPRVTGDYGFALVDPPRDILDRARATGDALRALQRVKGSC